MRNDEIFNMLEEQDLPEHFQIVAETCGIETARVLIKELGGITVSIPKLASLKGLIDKYVTLKKKTYPIQKIARDLEMNERTLVKVYGRKR